MRGGHYPTLTPARQHAYAMRVQRAWHYDNYDARRQAAIVERVKRLIAARPGSYLSRHWKEVYGR